MFADRVTINLKVNAAPELTRVIETEVIPLLRKQKVFSGEITSITAERSYAASDSFWETKGDVETYHHTGYQESLKSLLNVIVGLPMVGIFEASNSTFHMIAAKAA